MSLASQELPPKQPLLLLGKTTESFKLADLQTLEGQIQANHHCLLEEENDESFHYEYRRILLDQATGSSIFSLALNAEACVDSFLNAMPSSLQRSEWIGLVQVNETTPAGLLAGIDKAKADNLVTTPPWTMDYLRVQGPRRLQEKPPHNNTARYTSRSLLLSVAQRINQPRIALDPSHASENLLLVDENGERFYLINRLTRPILKQNRMLLQKLWSTRPFKYSSAIHFAVAEIVVDLLQSLLQPGGTPTLTGQRRPKLLDPTCGSGSFLGVALHRGFDVVGWDVNPKCIQGTQRNLYHVLGHNASDRFELATCDASVRDTHVGETAHYDCVVSNLPWGLNTVQYRKDDNFRILSHVRELIDAGTPCAFVAKKDLDFLPELGYQVLGKATVPPSNFALPPDKKKRSENLTAAGNRSGKRRNSCVVIIVRAV